MIKLRWCVYLDGGWSASWVADSDWRGAAASGGGPSSTIEVVEEEEERGTIQGL